MPILMLVACAKSEPTSATSGSTESDTQTTSITDSGTTSGTTDSGTTSTTTATADTAVTTTLTTTGTCSAVTPGTDWAWNGECPGMLTPCEVQVSGCWLTILYGTMSMGMPTDGALKGTDVQFGGGSVTGCVGTVVDADTIEGTCSGGCTYTLSR